MRVDAPWDAATVKALNEYQTCGQFHPFVCPYTHPGGRDLTATPAGWVCRRCGYARTNLGVPFESALFAERQDQTNANRRTMG